MRRSWQMPASITARSSSTCASSRAMRLKPMLTSRISLVSVFSSRRESRSPSRMRLAANDNCFSGRLIRLAITAEPTSVASSAMPTQIEPGAAVDRPRAGPHRPAASTGRDRSMKPTHSPGVPLTLRATTTRPGPSARSQLFADPSREPIDAVGSSQRSLGSRGSDRSRLLRRQALDQRDAVDAVGVPQRRACQVDQAGDLLCRLHGARLELECAERLQPGQIAPDQQQRQQEEGAPEQAQADRGRLATGSDR